MAQELIVNDKVTFLAGFGITPAALAVAPLATEGQDARSRHRGRHVDHHREVALHRAHEFHAAAITAPMADWAANNGIKKVVTSSPTTRPVSTPKSPSPRVQGKAARYSKSIRVPLANPDLRRSCNAPPTQKPDAIFVFVPSGQGGAFVKQFVERGLDKAGIKIIGPGDVTDDDQIKGMGDTVIGTVTAHMYSADHNRR